MAVVSRRKSSRSFLLSTISGCSAPSVPRLMAVVGRVGAWPYGEVGRVVGAWLLAGLSGSDSGIEANCAGLEAAE